jgi:uncharacterized membrane protein
MKILLLNDNPVVTKLVTLSAQKSGNEISIADSLETVQAGSYDLLIVDEGVYSKEKMDELNTAVRYKYSLYMLSRGTASVSSFDTEVKKPFLPTDLVELLSSIALKVAGLHEENNKNDDLMKLDEDDFSFDSDFTKDLGVTDSDAILDDLDFDLGDLDFNETQEEKKYDENSILDQDDVREVKNLLEETELDDEEFNFDDLELDDDQFNKELLDINLENEEKNADAFEDEFDFNELDILNDDEIKDAEEERASKESTDLESDDPFEDSLEMLDEHFTFDEKELHEDATEDDLDISEITSSEKHEVDEDHILEDTLVELEDDLDFDMLNEDVIADELDISELEDHIEVPEQISEEQLVSELDDDLDITELEYQEDDHEDELSLEDIEDKLETAIAGLSEEDLNEELDISLGELSDLESLDERSLKLALGEEVEEKESVTEVVESSSKVADENDLMEHFEATDGSAEKQNAGVDALKTLLKALNNEDVVAALKGMNVSINISFGNNDDK